MSVKHVLVPHTRYEALLSVEEKYFSQQQQQQQLQSPDSELKGTEEQLESLDPELKGTEEKLRQSSDPILEREDQQRLVKEDDDSEGDLKGLGADSSKTNLEEEELSLVRPPGIPARRGLLKKWLVWH